MDKEIIISATLSDRVDTRVIYEYCIEKGKDPNKINTLMSILVFNPTLLTSCYLDSLEYYQRKFNICILKNKEGRIITAY